MKVYMVLSKGMISPLGVNIHKRQYFVAIKRYDISTSSVNVYKKAISLEG